MVFVENIYNKYNGNIHYIINNIKLTSDDFDYLMDLKAHYNRDIDKMNHIFDYQIIRDILK